MSKAWPQPWRKELTGPPFPCRLCGDKCSTAGGRCKGCYRTARIAANQAAKEGVPF